MTNKKQVYSEMCPRCNGKGKYNDSEYGQMVTCDYKDCKGKGWVTVEDK